MDRASLRIGAKATQTNYYSVEQAMRLGLPFSHRVTINYASTVIDPRKAVESFSKLRRHHFNKWVMRPRKNAGSACAPTYAYAFENVRENVAFLTMDPGDPHNVHVHWDLHMPANRAFDFENELWSWVERTTGGITGGAETILVQELTGSYAGYLAKGTSPTWAKLYARGREAVPQGIIIGRRADTSRNLGPTARRALDRELGVKRQMPVMRPKHQRSEHWA